MMYICIYTIYRHDVYIYIYIYIYTKYTYLYAYIWYMDKHICIVSVYPISPSHIYIFSVWARRNTSMAGVSWCRRRVLLLHHIYISRSMIYISILFIYPVCISIYIYLATISRWSVSPPLHISIYFEYVYISMALGVLWIEGTVSI